jgi:hypothetical protein
MKQLLLTACALFLTSSLAFSQADNWCGTPDYTNEWLEKYQDNPNLFEKSDELLYIPLTIHITGSDNGGGYLPIKDVLNALCRLNLDFLESNIQFYVPEPFNYINNSEWHTHENFLLGIEMMNVNNVPNTINCYLVADPAGNCGYYAPSGNAVAMQKGCLGPNDHTWAHEIGHFLSLPHTFRGWEGQDISYNQPAPTFVGGREVEKADGSNCQTAGDRFCDTAADYLNFRWGCNADGSSQQLQKDPDSISFRSDGSFYMSYARDQCSNRFSQEQIDAMRANIFNARPGLLANPPAAYAGALTNFDASILAPADGATTPSFEEVTLRWESVDNATHYAVLMTNLPVFSGPLQEYIVQDTFLTLTDLEPNRFHYWRVRPYNNYGGWCTESIDTSSFTTGVLSNVSQLEEALQLSVYPNPVASDQELNVAIRLPEASAVRLRLYNMAGQVIYQEAYQTIVGTQTLTLPTNSIAAGLYLLGVETDQGMVHKKVNIIR